MYRGLKKRCSREEYIKLVLTQNRGKCYFCLHNSENYEIDVMQQKDIAAIKYFESLCRSCLNYPSKKKFGYLVDNFKTLYDWEENNSEGANNVHNE